VAALVQVGGGSSDLDGGAMAEAGKFLLKLGLKGMGTYLAGGVAYASGKLIGLFFPGFFVRPTFRTHSVQNQIISEWVRE